MHLTSCNIYWLLTFKNTGLSDSELRNRMSLPAGDPKLDTLWEF